MGAQNAESPSTREGRGAIMGWLRKALGLDRGLSRAKPGETLIFIERPRTRRPRVLQ